MIAARLPLLDCLGERGALSYPFGPPSSGRAPKAWSVELIKRVTGTETDGLIAAGLDPTDVVQNTDKIETDMPW